LWQAYKLQSDKFHATLTIQSYYKLIQSIEIYPGKIYGHGGQYELSLRPPVELSWRFEVLSFSTCLKAFIFMNFKPVPFLKKREVVLFRSFTIFSFSCLQT
jgi:hypothetical protein